MFAERIVSARGPGLGGMLRHCCHLPQSPCRWALHGRSSKRLGRVRGSCRLLAVRRLPPEGHPGAVRGPAPRPEAPLSRRAREGSPTATVHLLQSKVSRPSCWPLGYIIIYKQDLRQLLLFTASQFCVSVKINTSNDAQTPPSIISHRALLPFLSYSSH